LQVANFSSVYGWWISDLYLEHGVAKRFLAEYERWMQHEPAGGEHKSFRCALRDSVRSYASALRDHDPAAYKPFLFQPAMDATDKEGH
jgi:hypothetical protein